MQEHGIPLSRIARLKMFFSDKDVIRAIFFNICFVYVWGYLLWGVTKVGSRAWVLEECGHLLWSSFHTGIIISYKRRNDPYAFKNDRGKIEDSAWLWVILFSIFFEFGEFAHDQSGLFETIAQLSNGDTMADLLLSCFLGPKIITGYWRKRDGLKMFFTAPSVKEENDRDWEIVSDTLDRIRERMANEPPLMESIRGLVRNKWEMYHRIFPVIKSLYGAVVHENREERRRRRAYLRSIRLQKPID